MSPANGGDGGKDFSTYVTRIASLEAFSKTQHRSIQEVRGELKETASEVREELKEVRREMKGVSMILEDVRRDMHGARMAGRLGLAVALALGSLFAAVAGVVFKS